MKIIIGLLLASLMLSSCAPQTAKPASKSIPTATIAPTVTPTPTPATLANSPDLPSWVEDYVHAYGGKVTIDGEEMDAEQLTTAIRQNPDVFTQVKPVNGMHYEFL